MRGGQRVCTNLNTSEGDLSPILGDDKRASGVLGIQHGSELNDLQALVTDVLDSDNDPQFGYGRDFVGGSREKNLKTAAGANHGLGVRTGGRKTKSDKKQRKHGDAKESKGS